MTIQRALLAAAVTEAYRHAAKLAVQGEVVSYIPALANADPDRLGVSLVTKDGQHVSCGDTGTPFTLQSVVKIVPLTLALSLFGPERVFERVGMEPTGDPYNSLVKLETARDAKPLNPLINAGAISVCGLLLEELGTDAGMQLCLDAVTAMCHPGQVRLNDGVYRSELVTAHRNRALAHLLCELGVLRVPAEEAVQFYLQLCALEMDCPSLANMALFFAHSQTAPVPLARGIVVSTQTIRIVNTFLVTCGMYDASGEFAIRVGLPAKSGVSGAIMALVPGYLGIGVIGPALDNKGNSVKGCALLAHLSQALDLSMF
jgi:glutaminase